MNTDAIRAPQDIAGLLAEVEKQKVIAESFLEAMKMMKKQRDGELEAHQKRADIAEREVERLRADLASGDASDGYHTHNELYAYRRTYNALLFNEWARTDLHPVVKSWHHSDGELAFGGGWFIVVATLPTGQVSNHYEAAHWDLFQVPAVDLPPEYDGHTPAQALDRLRALLNDTNRESR